MAFNRVLGSTMASASPADIAEQIFRESPYHPLRTLKCSFREGVLTIVGRVPSYYLKQLAQSTVRGLNEVRQIRNLTEVPE